MEAEEPTLSTTLAGASGMSTKNDIQTGFHPSNAASPFVSRMQRPSPFTLVIFGATGDLAGRKLLPALYALWREQYLPSSFSIVGVGRRDKSDKAFGEEVRKSIIEFGKGASSASEGWSDFLGHVFYQRSDVTTTEGMQGLATHLKDLESEKQLPGNRLFYLAVDPEFFAPIIEGLANRS